MSPHEAKEILLLYRPGTADADDPEVSRAIEVARADPELGAWFRQHCQFQQAMRAKFREIEPPAHLKTALLAPANVIKPQPWWSNTRWLAAAAAVLFLLGLAGVWLQQGAPERLSNFQDRMVATAIREDRMDIVTNDMQQVRGYLARSGGPADYDIPQGLASLQLTGGGLLRWRSKPVSMVCFDRGDTQMLFLFVINRNAVKDPPPETPVPGTSHDLATVSWTKGDKTYVLAGPQEPNFAKKYL